jgi:hypothetical protein
MSKDDDRDQLALSRLPMPPSDSPLVIDLPDGQKLVLGNMAAGSVIEVATWRGTGRPDSRTSRLMLGVSQAESLAPVEGASASDAQESTSNASLPRSLLNRLQAFLRRFFHASTLLFATARGLILRFSISRLLPLYQRVPRPRLLQGGRGISAESPDSDTDISEWLTSIIAKSKIESSLPKSSEAGLINSGKKPRQAQRTPTRAKPNNSKNKKKSTPRSRSAGR